jgi:uncharacterized protein (DUF488 family)
LRLFTIGFTKKSAETFFTTLKGSGTSHLVDVRLRNVSQLAGFAKKDDLTYFLREICDIGYVHVPSLAPTQEILDRYRKDKRGWPAFRRELLALMAERRIDAQVPKETLANGCLLCGEDSPEHCHRRLVAEYLEEHWGGREIVHLA